MNSTRKDRRTPVPKPAKELVLRRDRALEGRLNKISAEMQGEVGRLEREGRVPFPENRYIHTVVRQIA
jgi:hypothetical protein